KAITVSAGTGVDATDPRATQASLDEGKPKAEATVIWDAPETLQEFIEAYGEEVAYDHAMSTAERNLGNRVRADLNNGLAEEEIKAKYENGGYVPGVSQRSDPADRMFANFEEQPLEKQLRVLEQSLSKLGLDEDTIRTQLDRYRAQQE